MKNVLKIMLYHTDPNTIGITESWENNDETCADLELVGYARFEHKSK